LQRLYFFYFVTHLSSHLCIKRCRPLSSNALAILRRYLALPLTSDIGITSFQAAPAIFWIAVSSNGPRVSILSHFLERMIVGPTEPNAIFPERHSRGFSPIFKLMATLTIEMDWAFRGPNFSKMPISFSP